MRVATSDELLTHLRQSDLVPPERLAAWLETRPGTGEESPAELAHRLVAAGLVTSYQVDLLLKGRSRDLTIAGKYKVLDLLGKGGMGAVYLCEHQALRTLVAVKVLPASPEESREDRERFYREARAFATLNHPNLVRGFDVDADAGQHFIVMEYVDGVDLQALVARCGPLPVGRAVNYTRQAANGLAHAHDRGWVHRDIKPANLAVDRTGLVRVLDMGLARGVFEGSDAITRDHNDGTIRGTADFLSPEQADGSPLDGRADFYSLGVTLYFLLSAQLPFGELSVGQKLVAHLLKTPPPLRGLRPDLPEKLVQVVDKMMAKRPGDRYRSGAEVADALAPWDTGPCPPTDDEVSRRLPPGIAPALVATAHIISPLTPTASVPRRGANRLQNSNLVRIVVGFLAVATFAGALAGYVSCHAPQERGGGPPPVVATASPFIGNYVAVTRAHGPNQVPFPGGHAEYLQGRVYRTVAAALSDPRLREQDNCRVLLLDEVHEEQAEIDATKLPHGIAIESVRPGKPTHWHPPENSDPTRPLLRVTGGARLAVRNLEFNGLRRIEVPVSWTGAGPGCQLYAVGVTGYTRSGIALRDPAGEAGDPVQLSRVRVHPESTKTPLDACVQVSAAARPARHLRLTECRFEGPATEGVLSAGGITAFEMTRCRLFGLQNGVRFAGPGALDAALTGNTTASTRAAVLVDALPPNGDANRRLALRSNLFYDADVAVRFAPAVMGTAELFRGSEGNWCEHGGCRTRTDGLPVSEMPGQVLLELDPTRDDFLKYPATSPLAIAGPNRQPVGVPPG